MECGKANSKIQRKTPNEGQSTEVPPIVREVLRSPGHPLDAATRAFMQPRFRQDFSDVRVHTDAKAADSARSVNALAYTVGQDVAFGAGQYLPSTISGMQTLAHELTHVVQQGSGQYPQSGNLTTTNPRDAAEQEADAVSRSIVGEDPINVSSHQYVTLARVPDAGALPASPGPDAGAGPAAPGPDAGAPAAPGPAPDAGAVAPPSVALGNFKNSGNTDGENNCPLCPKTLGVAAASGTNAMEIRGDITGHVAGAQYDIKRTKERATWKKVGAAWTQLSHLGPGADDDSHDSDEDLTPENNHIFVIDTPGFEGLGNPTGDAAATEGVYKASFVETCNVKVGAGAWAQSSNSLEWHSISWLEKSGATWRRKAGSSEIGTGSTTVGTGDP
jgi:hypothetical protein